MSTFRCSRWYSYLLAGSGLGSNFLVAYYPSVIPYDYLGPVGTVLHYTAYDLNQIFRVTFIAVVSAHAAEAVYALVLCRRANLSITDHLLWSLHTFVLGFPSLLLLKKAIQKRQARYY